MSLIYTAVSPYTGLSVQYKFLPHHIEAIQRYCVRAGISEHNIRYDFIHELITGAKHYANSDIRKALMRHRIPPRCQHNVVLPDDLFKVIATHCNIASTPMINLTCKLLLPRDPIFKLLVDFPKIVLGMLPHVKATVGDQLLMSQLARACCILNPHNIISIRTTENNLIHNLVRSYQAICPNGSGSGAGYFIGPRVPTKEDYRYRTIGTNVEQHIAKHDPEFAASSEFGNTVQVYIEKRRWPILVSDIGGMVVKPFLSNTDVLKILLIARPYCPDIECIRVMQTQLYECLLFSTDYNQVAGVLKYIPSLYGSKSAIQLVEASVGVLDTQPLIGDPDAIVAMIPNYHLNKKCLHLNISTEWVNEVSVPSEQSLYRSMDYDYRVAQPIPVIQPYAGMMASFTEGRALPALPDLPELSTEQLLSLQRRMFQQPSLQFVLPLNQVRPLPPLPAGQVPQGSALPAALVDPFM